MLLTTTNNNLFDTFFSNPWFNDPWYDDRDVQKAQKKLYGHNGKRDGLSYKEIAEELSVSVLTVRNHLALAMKELRRAKPVIQVILTLLMMLFPLISYGQEQSVLSSMKAIESGFGYNFVYESSVKRLLENETKQVKFDSNLLEDCLQELFGDLPIKWKVQDKTHSIILIVNDNVRKSAPKSYTISGYVPVCN